MKYDSSIGDGTYSADGPCAYPTPGYPNTQSGFEQYQASVKLPDLYISEVMSSNKKYSPVDGNYYDIVELYNGGSSAVQLHGYFLSDKKSELKKYNLPEYELGPGKYCVIYCSGLEKAWHAPFKVSSSGEKLYLSTDAGVITDF
ncbi:MAG: lamin tail domain-containing protein, partial [Clostridia bacterium]|nr:lamin tail domain-containing protein [Clostridia bacterium]